MQIRYLIYCFRFKQCSTILQISVDYSSWCPSNSEVWGRDSEIRLGKEQPESRMEYAEYIL